MNINWQEIKEKYPEAWIKFKKSTLKEKLMGLSYKDDKDLVERILNYYIKLCYCDMLKFFDVAGLRIDIFYNQFCNFIYHINYDEDKNYGGSEFNSREEAQDAAIIKAFEILNTMIDKGDMR